MTYYQAVPSALALARKLAENFELIHTASVCNQLRQN